MPCFTGDLQHSHAAHLNQQLSTDFSKKLDMFRQHSASPVSNKVRFMTVCQLVLLLVDYVAKQHPCESLLTCFVLTFQSCKFQAVLLAIGSIDLQHGIAQAHIQAVCDMPGDQEEHAPRAQSWSSQASSHQLCHRLACLPQ